jgi:hypothetical protein
MPIAFMHHQIRLAHTSNGRKMRQDDNQKLPFQWMIDNDNAALEKILSSID